MILLNQHFQLPPRTVSSSRISLVNSFGVRYSLPSVVWITSIRPSSTRRWTISMQFLSDSLTHKNKIFCSEVRNKSYNTQKSYWSSKISLCLSQHKAHASIHLTTDSKISNISSAKSRNASVNGHTGISNFTTQLQCSQHFTRNTWWTADTA